MNSRTGVRGAVDAGSSLDPARADAGSGGASKAIARGSVANLLGALISATANFLLVLLVARYATAVQAGVFFGVTSLFLILEALLRLGSDVGVVYFIARWRALGTPERIVPALGAAFVPVLSVSVLVAIATVLAAPALANIVADGHHEAVGMVRTLAIVLPVAVVYDVALGVTRGFSSMRATVLTEKIARPVLQILLVAIVLAAGWLGGLAPAWALPYLVAAAAAGWAMRSALRGLGTGTRPTVAQMRAVGREFWAFTAPRAVTGVAQIVLQRLDIVLMAALRGPRDAAVYTAATRFLVLGQFVSQAIAAPVQPRLSAALSAGDTSRARALYRTSTTWIVLLSWPMFLTVAVFAPLYVGLFGSAYTSGAVVVVILAGSMLVASVVGVVDAVVIMAGRTSWNLATTLGALAVNIVLNIVLIPPFGIIGAATAWCAAIVVANGSAVLLAWRGLGVHPYSRATARGCLLAALLFGVLPLAGMAVSTLVAVALLLLGSLLYAAALWRWREEFELSALRPTRKATV